MIRINNPFRKLGAYEIETVDLNAIIEAAARRRQLEKMTFRERMKFRMVRFLTKAAIGGK